MWLGYENLSPEPSDGRTCLEQSSLWKGSRQHCLRHRLSVRGELKSKNYANSLDIRTQQEGEIIQRICGRRANPVIKGTPGLQVIFLPVAIVGLDLTLERTGKFSEKTAELFEDAMFDSADEV